MRAKQPAPNPTGKTGRPITLAHLSFDEAVRKMLATEPPKHEPRVTKKKTKQR